LKLAKMRSSKKSQEFYTFLEKDYDKMINWEQRLSQEIPFLKTLFCSHQANSILDLGAGTGRHSLALAQEGFEVVGVEPFPPFLKIARIQAQILQEKLIAESRKPKIEFIPAEFSNLLKKVKKRFDALICLGNTLAHLPNLSALKKSCRDFFNLLLTKGIVVIQIIDAEAIPLNEYKYMPVRNWEEQGKEKIILRKYTRIAQDSFALSAIKLEKEMNGWKLEETSQKLLAINKKELTQALKQAGFGSFKYFSDFKGTPFVSKKNESLILVCQK
jgi:glycine/sarcosine N-methyltransferase